MSSWFFGGKKEPQSFNEFVPPPAAITNTKESNKEMEAYKFDSAALERAAAAAKDLERSKYAKESLELTKKQEEIRHSEVIARQKEFEVHLEQMKIEAQSKEYDMKRKFLQDQAKNDQQKAQYQDQLARKRYDDQLMQQKKLHDDNLKQQEESVARQEALKRETFEKEFERGTQRDQQKVHAKYEAKGKYLRENKDLLYQQLQHEKEQERESMVVRMREQRNTTLASIKSLSSAVGYALDTFVSSPEKIKNIGLGVVAVAAGIYTAKRGTVTMFSYLETKLLKPQLVTRTSRITPIDFFKHPVKTFHKMKSKPEGILDGIILHPKVDARVRDIAISTKNTKKNKGFFSNITLYGPPGTGKTMFAERLATISGMDYAIVAGGDLSIPGKDAVYQLNKLFDWAESTKKGMILFVDEADAFMVKRSSDSTSQEHNNILSTFLHRTGGLSKKFSLVLATNRPEAFDYAISNRSHEFVVFPLPTLPERERLVMKYFKDFILVPSTSGRSRLKLGEFDHSATCKEVARVTEDFSGREICNLANDWQSTTYASESGILSKDLMMTRTIAAIQQNKMRKVWYNDTEKQREKFSLALMRHATESGEAQNKKSVDNDSEQK